MEEKKKNNILGLNLRFKFLKILLENAVSSINYLRYTFLDMSYVYKYIRTILVENTIIVLIPTYTMFCGNRLRLLTSLAYNLVDDYAQNLIRINKRKIYNYFD